MRKLSILSALAILLFSCQKNIESNARDSISQDAFSIPSGYQQPECGSPSVTALMAGQNDNVGDIGVWNDENNIYVSFQTIGAYRLKKTHLFVGDCGAIPTNGAGNPRIGLFPYTMTHGTTGVSVYTYTIPRTSVPAGSVCVAAHAEVVAFDASGNQYYSQTGWGSGPQINDGGSWAMKFCYSPQQCPTGEVR